eukprot:CAMPEP_0172528806 /NCGR_PEP_ID=MMETSP1067-20121228/3065_1 /TAXON_ID=265564 ORGANISM="Thalassiosira punctigera, Strain Tpunct2005C2" /NCGR_SAMPLE_ID=MMETSP1067 /ASSEMBLY_ACC=CAM_ASM_000444 /LENGTH=103 /DNA_ID=CAMNT_0013312771 /DNA_START=126 /DNA_END=434 /DNA_ORIENTATION=-
MTIGGACTSTIKSPQKAAIPSNAPPQPSYEGCQDGSDIRVPSPTRARSTGRREPSFDIRKAMRKTERASIASRAAVDSVQDVVMTRSVQQRDARPPVVPVPVA